ncbi:MAG: BMC domain-containing protein [Desulfovibrio sp.]|uniref:BMC domain-containing protein n=1 Tax=Desulfovibrio sp. 7SRBS1 TaxID=3378064 RepID=UPI003B421F69
MNRHIINAPGPEVRKMLERRVPQGTRAQLQGLSYDAVGLVQTSIASLFYYADLVDKASDVLVAEINGSCPQHITTLAFFGETASVVTAMQAIEAVEGK